MSKQTSSSSVPSFVPKDFQKFIEANCYETRQKWRELSKADIFRPRFNLSLIEEQELALQRLKEVAKHKVFSVHDFGKNPLNVFANHEMGCLIDGSMTTKLTVLLNLFGGTVYALGTQRHLPIAQGIDDLSVIGCFALTELGYGNNAVQMETTSTYDAEKKEFIINSPSVLSQKYWITNGAIHCNYAIVFAQLYMPQPGTNTKKHEGVHAFLVRVRDQAGKVLPGIFIEDMGAKFGANGVDNGRLSFKEVRIPRENLLNRFSDVSPDGKFTSTISNKRGRFIKVADRLLSGRLCIASMMISGTQTALTTTLRYGSKRLAVGEQGLSDAPISSFNLFQNAICPLLARTIVLNIALNRVKDLYSETLLKKKQADTYLICLCCMIKPLVSWNARDVGTTVVERVGGQGYLSCNRLAELIPLSHSGITAQGDNAVLMQKVAKEIMDLVEGGKFPFPDVKTPNMKNLSEGFSSKTLEHMIQYRELRLIEELKNVTRKGVVENQKSIYVVWMKEENVLVQDLARAFAERTVAQFSRESIDQSANSIKDTLNLIFNLHLHSVVLQNLSWYLINEVVDKKGAYVLESQFKTLVRQVGEIALDLSNSFGIPEHLLTAPISQDYEQFNSKPNKGETFMPKL